MYECNIVEAEDFGFNHYIHHIDDEEYFTCITEVGEIEYDDIECDEALYENNPNLFDYFAKVGINE